jgi:predicted trehalose synthase
MMEFSLLETLSKPTESKIEDPVIDPVIDPVDDPVIDPPKEPEIDTTEEAAKDTEKETGDKIRSLVDDEDTAQMIIDAYDALNGFLLPVLYERAAMTKTERKALKETLRKIRSNERNKSEDGSVSIEFSQQEVELLSIADEAKDYEEDLVPLTEKEIKAIKKPLTKLISKIDVNVSPLGALSFVLILTAVPRILPLLGVARSKKSRS